VTVSDHGLRRLAWAVFLLLPLVFAASLALAVLGRADGDPVADGLLSDLSFSLVILVFPVVGLLIVRRQPRNTVGWVLLAIGLVWGLSGLADVYSTYGLVVAPGAVPAAEAVAALNQGAWVPGIGLMGTFLILLYPDGHLPSARWRPVAWLSGVAMVALTLAIAFSPEVVNEGPVVGFRNPVGWDTGEPLLRAMVVIFLPIFPLCIVASATALVRRFRRSTGVERLQLKWLTAAGAAGAMLYVLAMASMGLVKGLHVGPADPLWLRVIGNVAVSAFVLLPIAIGIAVLRHGLYEIDVVINRALVYGALTATLAAVYLGTVLLLQQVASPVTHRSDLATVGSTLAVAALFRPVRSRIQTMVDHRFSRSRYDAARSLEAFTRRLRHEVDVESVGADLRAAVDQSLRPEHVSVWVRP
jgi:hypothetical protein